MTPAVAVISEKPRSIAARQVRMTVSRGVRFATPSARPQRFLWPDSKWLILVYGRGSSIDGRSLGRSIGRDCMSKRPLTASTAEKWLADFEFRPLPFLRNPHLQTVLAALVPRPNCPLPDRRRIVRLPDDDALV